MSSEHREVDVGNNVVNGLVPTTNGQKKDVDPAKVCTGKGAVTLWASPAHEEKLSTSQTNPQDVHLSETSGAEPGKPETDDLLPSVDSNRDAQSSALAAKGYRSVRPNLFESKSHTPSLSRLSFLQQKSLAWCPHANTKVTFPQPISSMDCLDLNAPKPYTHYSPPSNCSRQCFSSSPTTSSAAPVGLNAASKAHVGQSLLGSSSLLPNTSSEHQNTLEVAGADHSSKIGLKSNHETRGEKKVSSLYVACLSNSTCSAAFENSIACADVQTEGTRFGAEVTVAPVIHCVSTVTDTGNSLPPPSPPPPRPFFNIVSSGNSVSYGESCASRTPQAADNTKTESPHTAGSENRMRTEPDVTQQQQQQQQQQQHPCKKKGYGRDATYSAATPPPQTEVIVVPFQQVHPDSKQEGSLSTPALPLVPSGQSSEFPDNTSAGSLLTFPTLDDFIPPHLQKDSSHNLPSSSSETVHLKLISLSPPPPPLIPPVREISNLESENTGMILYTDPCPQLYEAPRTSSGTECYGSLTVASKPSSAYPSTTIVNPTIVLLQHNREQQKRLSSLTEPVQDAPVLDKVDSIPMEEKVGQWKKQAMEDGTRVTKCIADSSLDDIGIPLRNTDRSKDWYKTMFKQIHRLTKDPPEENPYCPTYKFPEFPDNEPQAKEENPYSPTYQFPVSTPSPKSEDEDSDSYVPQYSFYKDTSSVPRSKSENDTITTEKVVKRSATLPLPTRSSSLIPSSERTDWEPPDKKVDTRKYRAEPKSIYEYQPGKSSVLANENLTRDISTEEIDLKNEPWYKFFSELEFGKPTDPEKDLYLYQTELEADIEKMEKLYRATDKKQLKLVVRFSVLRRSLLLLGRPLGHRCRSALGQGRREKLMPLARDSRKASLVWIRRTGRAASVEIAAATTSAVAPFPRSVLRLAPLLQKRATGKTAACQSGCKNSSASPLFLASKPNDREGERAAATFGASASFKGELWARSPYLPDSHLVKRELEDTIGDSTGLEKERHIYKSVLEGGDIPLQGLSGLKRPSSSASTKVDRKGGNAHTIASSSVNSRTINSNNAGQLGQLYKYKKPLSAAKVCIAEILPSKFKHKLATPPIPRQDNKDLLPHEKTQSCENLHSKFGLFGNKKDSIVEVDTSFENILMKSKQQLAAKSSSTQSLKEYGSSSFRKGYTIGSQKNGMEFTMLYKDMHHINRSEIQLGIVSSCSVKEIASHFESEFKDKREPSPSPSPSQENLDQIPKHTVSSRITAFELLIQRSLSMPALNFSSSHIKSPTPSLSNSCLSSVYSAEYQLDLSKPIQEEKNIANLADISSHSCSNIEDTSSEFSDMPPMETLLACSDEIDLISNRSSDSGGYSSNISQKYKVNKCKGSCPASYTRFTTIRRHEQQQPARGDVEGEKHLLPRNVYLMSPLPFRLKRPLQSTSRKTPPLPGLGALLASSCENQNNLASSKGSHRENPFFYELHAQQKPPAPMRLSSYDIVKSLFLMTLYCFEVDSESPRHFPPLDYMESPEDIFHRRHSDKEKLLEDQRRLKREQEEADIAARRHTGVIPTHHQFITNERFGDLLIVDDTAKRKSGSEMRAARAKFDFKAQTLKELPLQKGDIVYIYKQIDQNWYEGEHHGRVGIFPQSYVELLPPREKPQPRKTSQLQVLEYGDAVAKFSFNGDTQVEMSFKKSHSSELLFTPTPPPLPFMRPALSPELQAVTSEWISLTLGATCTQTPTVTPPLPPLPDASLCNIGYLSPSSVASPSPSISLHHSNISNSSTPTSFISPLPSSYEPQSSTQDMSLMILQSEEKFASSPSYQTRNSNSPYSVVGSPDSYLSELSDGTGHHDKSQKIRRVRGSIDREESLIANKDRSGSPEISRVRCLSEMEKCVSPQKKSFHTFEERKHSQEQGDGPKTREMHSYKDIEQRESQNRAMKSANAKAFYPSALLSPSAISSFAVRTQLPPRLTCRVNTPQPSHHSLRPGPDLTESEKSYVETVCNEILNIAEKSVHYCSTISQPLVSCHKGPFSDSKSSLIISQQPQVPLLESTLERNHTPQDILSYQALYSYIPQNDDELELKDGDIIDVMEKCDDGWFVGTSRRTQQFGTFPGNYVKLVSL
ncbi:hypothetical protein JD844_031784 [Phrynosoma platyrhinos]|uniref:Sorbin and SH3 domain-containing protein 1 n=1 Tax=Phrynosoma platyrhinos TaxID=52577 RepID=A0ABQ7T4G4_PHRPL|nr:hypothetical protein JD844_031784 [Phrynosoma platyrhinos]